jgi:hypothetical protein
MLVTVIVTIPKSFRIIIRHKSNFNSELFSRCLFCTPLMFLFVLYFVICLTLFQFLIFNLFFFGLVGLYFVVKFFNELEFFWHFV